MGRKNRRKRAVVNRSPSPNNSETDTASSGEIKKPYVYEKYIRESPTMEDEEIDGFEQFLPSPQEILGLHRFYTDEFDAFHKYYAKINDCLDDNSIMNFANAVDQLPYSKACELSEKVKKIPKKDEQNIDIPRMATPNDKIEFAHADIEMVETNDKGKHLIASNHIEKGQLLIDEKAAVLQVNPLCVCMSGEHKMYRCHHCAYAVHKFYTCATCNIVLYCSVRCLVQSYNNYHRYECEGLQRHYWKLNDTDYSYIAFRMILYGARYKFNHDVPEGYTKWGIDGNNYPFIYKLESHFNEIPVRRVYEILTKAAQTVTYLLLRTSFFNDIELTKESIMQVGGLFVKHYCQAQMNCVLLKYPNFDAEYAFNTYGGKGKAICPTVALLNHSCNPNAVIIPCNDRVLVKALRRIDVNEEITVAYHEINTFFALDERQLLMTDYFYFKVLCNCSFCRYETTWQEYPYKCRNCKMGKAKKVTLNNGDQQLLCRDCESYSSIDSKSEKTAEIADRTTYHIDPIIRVAESYDQIYPWDSWILLDTYRIIYDKYAGWGEKPMETIKYGMMYFSILERYISKLFPPILEAKMRFFYGVVNTVEFVTMKTISDGDYETLAIFCEECLRTKKDLLFYVPIRYLDFYYLGLLAKLESVQLNLKIIEES